VGVLDSNRWISLTYKTSEIAYIPVDVVLDNEVVCGVGGALESAVRLEEELFKVGHGDCDIDDRSQLAVFALTLHVCFADGIEAGVCSVVY
jgi:hypothetical protein